MHNLENLKEIKEGFEVVYIFFEEVLMGSLCGVCGQLESLSPLDVPKQVLVLWMDILVL